MKLSIFASAIRPHLWEDLLKSLRGGKYPYEVIFAGHIDQSLVKEMFSEYPEFRYITTGEIKPAQCYEIARRACTGRLIHWTADDAIYSPGFVDHVCDYYDSIESINPIIISCRTNENNNNETMMNHRFFERNQNTPIMSPLGIMTKEYSDYLGGLDSRYIAGQWENDLLMRAYSGGAKCFIYEDVIISLDHAAKHKANDDFKGGYNEDREQLENSWVVGGYQPHPDIIVRQLRTLKEFKEFEKNPNSIIYRPITNYEVTLKRNDEFCPYPAEISLTESLPPKGIWS